MPAEKIRELEKSYNDLVMAWNGRVNLVSRRKTNIYDLIEDSKLFLQYIDFREGLEILDLGTGGGIPGIVIKIHHPEIHLTLLDSIRKKADAVTDIVNKLRFQSAEVVCTRAEELGKQDKYKNSFDYIVARSVATLENLVKWSKNLVKPAGKLITVKGGNINEEILRARRCKYLKSIEVFEDNNKKVLLVQCK